jgi:hypothetical protein
MKKFYIFLIVLLCSVQDANAYWRWYNIGNPWTWGSYYYGPAPTFYIPSQNYVTSYVQPQPRYTESQIYQNKLKNLEDKNNYLNKTIDAAYETQSKKLDMVEKYAQLKVREEDYIKRGYLPPKPVKRFVWKGIEYKSYEEFKHTPAFQELVEEGNRREQEREEEFRKQKEQEQLATIGLARIRAEGPVEKQNRITKQRVLQSLENDIASGKYSPTEVKKMMQLWLSIKN